MIMTEEKQKLTDVMQKIKALLNEADVAAAIVLTTPLINGQPEEFVTIRHDHVNASFSYAKTMKHHCCEKCGTVEGIVLHAEAAPGEDQQDVSRKLVSTIGMFAGLAKGSIKTTRMCEKVILQVTAAISEKGKDTDLTVNKPCMN
jgi:DNA-binding FrmR family transcriptional regulator